MAGGRVEVVVDGDLERVLGRSLEGFQCVRSQGGRTRIVGDVADQSALIGLLELLDELHVDVVSMRRSAAPDVRNGPH